MIPITVYVLSDDGRRLNPGWDLDDNEIHVLKQADVVDEMMRVSMQAMPQWVDHMIWAMGRQWPNITPTDELVIGALMTRTAARTLTTMGGAQRTGLMESARELSGVVDADDRARILQPVFRQCGSNPDFCSSVGFALFDYYEKLAYGFNEDAIAALRASNAIPMEYEAYPDDELDIGAGLRDVLGEQMEAAGRNPSVYELVVGAA